MIRLLKLSAALSRSVFFFVYVVCLFPLVDPFVIMRTSAPVEGWEAWRWSVKFWHSAIQMSGNSTRRKRSFCVMEKELQLSAPHVRKRWERSENCSSGVNHHELSATQTVDDAPPSTFIHSSVMSERTIWGCPFFFLNFFEDYKKKRMGPIGVWTSVVKSIDQCISEVLLRHFWMFSFRRGSLPCLTPPIRRKAHLRFFFVLL